MSEMVQRENMTKEKALKILQKQDKLLCGKLLVEKSLTREILPQILNPMQPMSWEDRGMYAQELITILETTKNQQGIVEKAKLIDIH